MTYSLAHAPHRDGLLLRAITVACVALCVSLTSPIAAHAQTTEPDAQLADASYVRDVGAGLTIAGLTTTAGGTALFFGIASGNGFGAAIGGGLLWGIGGLFSLAGIPTWIVGSVRASILAAAEPDRSRVAWSYELAGIVTTLVGIGLTLVGGALIAAGAGTNELDVTGTGGVLIPIGFFVATFIGPPLWAEGGRF